MMCNGCGRFSISIFTALAALTACQGTAGEPDGPSAPIAIQDGRLRFADVQTFVDTVTQLNSLPADQLTPDYFASHFTDFTSLAMLDPATRPDVPSMAEAMLTILDPEGTYQVDDRIFMVRAEAEYVIPYTEQSLVARIAAGESAQPYVASGRIQSHPLSRRSSDAAKTSYLLDAKYQSEFSAGGLRYKFVDEAYVDAYSTYLMACFRSKLEYFDKKFLGGDWAAAGERVYKEITSPHIGYVVTPRNRSASITPSDQIRNDSLNLEICTQIIPQVGFCVSKPQLTASYYSEGNQANIAGNSYEVSAEWTTEFTGQTACN